jgi:hypothetical protein
MGDERGGGVGREEVWGLLGFGALVYIVYNFAIVVVGACVRDCRRLGVCKVGTKAYQQVVDV